MQIISLYVDTRISDLKQLSQVFFNGIEIHSYIHIYIYNIWKATYIII